MVVSLSLKSTVLAISTIIILLLIILLSLYFTGFLNPNGIRLLISGNSSKSKCIYVNLSEKPKLINLDDEEKNKRIKNLVGKYEIENVAINSPMILVKFNKIELNNNIRKTAEEINNLYGDEFTYVIVLSPNDSKLNTIFQLTKKENFSFITKPSNITIDIPDINYYVYGYGESPKCV